LCRYRGRADERAAAAVGLQRAPQDKRFAGIGFDPELGEEGVGGMTRGKLDLRRNRRGRLAITHQPGIGAQTQRKPKRVQQDRLACSGFAGEDTKARFEIECQRFDQHHVADDELP